MGIITRRSARLGLAIVLVIALMGLLALHVAAAEFRGDETIVIGSDEVTDDDLFLAGNTITVDGTVNGNLFVFCSRAEINGTVNGNLVFGGQTIIVNGKVRDSFFGGGSEIVLGPQASVGRNLFVGGYGLEAKSGSKIGRDLYMAGYQALLNGEVVRDVKYAGAALELIGKVGRDVEAEVGVPGEDWARYARWPGMPETVVPQGLRVSEQATIGGNLTYTSMNEQAAAIKARPSGQVIFRQQLREQAKTPTPAALAAGWLLDRARELVTLLLFGFLAAWLLPGVLVTVADKIRTQPLPSAGWGLLGLVGGYAAAVVVGLLILVVAILIGIITLGGLASTVLGLGFGALGLAFTVFQFLISYGSKLVVAYLVGKLLLEALKAGHGPKAYVPVVVGVVLYVALASIPLLGWLVGAAATLVGLGAIWLALRERRAQVHIALA